MKTKFLFSAPVLFFLLSISSACTTEQNMIDNPQVGDVYQVEYNNIDGHKQAYQLVKVKAVNGEKVIVMPNKVYYDEKVYCLTDGDYFSIREAYLTTKTKIKAMYGNKNIVEVFRVYEASCLGNNK